MIPNIRRQISTIHATVGTVSAGIRIWQGCACPEERFELSEADCIYRVCQMELGKTSVNLFNNCTNLIFYQEPDILEIDVNKSTRLKIWTVWMDAGLPHHLTDKFPPTFPVSMFYFFIVK